MDYAVEGDEQADEPKRGVEASLATEETSVQKEDGDFSQKGGGYVAALNRDHDLRKM